MARLIMPNGDSKQVDPAGDVFTLQEMYDLLNCSCVQAVSLPVGRIMWIDEEGKFKPHTQNHMATILLRAAGGIPGDYIAGAALLTEAHEIE